MGCRIMGNDEMACFYCSTTMIAFGPVTTREELERFEDWLDCDPRCLNIMKLWADFVKENEDEE